MWEIIQFLFPPFIACLTLVGIHGYLGIHVLKREIIFIDIAMAQISAVGSTVAFVAWRKDEHTFIAYLCALGFTFLAALFFSTIRKKITQIHQEAVIGILYAIAAAAALFLLSMAAGVDVHLEHMLTGSILWAKWSDILPCAGVYAAIGVFHYIFRDKFMKISFHYEDAIKEGINVTLWDFLFYATFGIVVTHSVRIAGVLVVFALLVIPATVSAMYTESWIKRLMIAYSLGVVITMLGLAFSFVFDFSCGPSVVTFLGLALIFAAIIRKFRPASE